MLVPSKQIRYQQHLAFFQRTRIGAYHLAYVRAVLALGVAALTVACTQTVYLKDPNDRRPQPPFAQEAPPIDRAIFPAVGDRAFITANDRELLSAPGSDSPAYAGSRGELAEGDTLAGATSNDSAPAPGAAEPMPEPDPTRLIVEGDVFKLDGTTLYVMHRYRGLLIFDLSAPDHIKLLGRLPFQAKPVEMYVRDGRAYAVVSDYFAYWQYDRDADPLGFHGSMVLVADVSNPASPYLMGKMGLQGEVSDTRMVGNVLYAVSKRNPEYWRYNTADWKDTTWVKSIHVGDPANIYEVDGIEFAGTSTVAHVYHHAIFVAAHDPNAYLTDPAHENETLVTYVDISDPAGRLKKRGSLYVPGYIQDKFKLDYHERTLRVLSQRYTGGQSDGFVHTIDVGHPDTPALLRSLDLSSANYGALAASRMSAARGYALTNRYENGRTRHELHVLDLSDPNAPRRTGATLLDGTVSHFEVRGERLLAMGHSWESTSGYYRSTPTVSVIDVSDAAAPRVLSVAKLGQGYAYSLANQDYKAFRVVDSMQLILVPLSFYDRGTSFQGMQIIDYTVDAVRARGIVANAGSVERAFPVGERIVSLSQHQLQIIDARDRDNPIVTASIHLVRNVLGVWNIRGKAVQLIGEVLRSGTRLEVLEFGREDDGPRIAALDLPYPSSPVVFRDGDVLRLIGWETSGQVIRNADLSDPSAPRLRGELRLTNEFERIYNAGMPFYYLYWSPWAGLPLENRILPVTVRKIITSASGRRDFQSFLRLIDLRDADHPRVARGELPMPKWPFVNKVTHGKVLHSSHVEETKTEAGTTLLYHVRSYLDRIDVSDPDAPRAFAKINIPGYLVDVSHDGQIAFTIDYQWDAFGRRRNSLNVLRIAGDEALLTDVLAVGDQVNRAVFRDRTVWLVTHKYPWWGVGSDTLESRQPYTILSRVDVDEGGTIVGHSAAKLRGYHFELLDVEDSRAYLASSRPAGVLVLDARNPAQPAHLSSARSVSYVSKIVTHGDHAYTPLGWFGVHRIPLSGGAQ
jgi:hypothetical protein